ncbi:MAG: hypothetical protein WKF84_12165 [Pyrinomonadaceae bacterium]
MLARPDVRVVGRCARDVIIEGTGKNAAFAIPRGTFTLEGVTLRNFQFGVQLSGAVTRADVRHVLFDGNGLAISARAGARATMWKSAVDAGSRAQVSGDPIRAVVAERSEGRRRRERHARSPSRSPRSRPAAR